MLEGILGLAAERQGVRADAKTGEEIGKVPHELPGVQLNGHSTLFAACDTTALFMIGTLRALQLRHGFAALDEATLASDALWLKLRPAFLAALSYLKRHLQPGQTQQLEEGAFVEDPVHADATEFALPSTYWKARASLPQLHMSP